STSPTGVAVDARRLAMEMLGKRIAELRPGCKVLVLSNPFTRDAGLLDEKARVERAGIGGLRDGLGRRSPVKPVYPEIQPEYFSNPGSVMIPPDSPTPLSFLIVPASVDELAEANPGHDVIVSLIGLPAGVERLRIWGEKDPHCF